MPSIGRSSIRRTRAIAGGWSDLLQSEDPYVAEHAFGAGVLLIHYAGELLRHSDDDARNVAEAAVLSIIDRHLSWTDRTAMVGTGRLGVVMVPVEGPLALSRRAREVHRELRASGIDIDIAYSVRRQSGGLQAATARADAALDTALSRRSASGRL